MSKAVGITVDGTAYKVGIQYESMKRSFEIRQGSGKTSAVSGKVILDPIGLYYSYKMKFRCLPDNQADYDALFLKLSEPVFSHSISLPFNQRVYTFDAMIESGSDKYEGTQGGVKLWDEMDISFVPVDRLNDVVLAEIFGEE